MLSLVLFDIAGENRQTLTDKRRGDHTHVRSFSLSSCFGVLAGSFVLLVVAPKAMTQG
jgi:hypothetical protein